MIINTMFTHRVQATGEIVWFSAGTTRGFGTIQEIKPGRWRGSVLVKINGQWYSDPSMQRIQSRFPCARQVQLTTTR